MTFPPRLRRGLSSPWVVVLVAVVLRSALVVAEPTQATGGDGGAYVFVAHTLRDTGSLPDERGLPAVMPPLLPLLLAVLSFAGDAAGILLLKVLNVAAGAVAVGLAFSIGRRLSDARGGAVAAWLVALHPMFVLYARDVAAEPLYLPMLLGTLELFARLRESPTFRRSVALGALLGASILLRPVVAPWALATAALVLWPLRGVPLGRRVAHAGALGLAVLVVVLPWSAYVSRRFGEPILVTDTAGFNFWDGHHPSNLPAMRASTQAERDAIVARKDEERRALTARLRQEGLGRGQRSHAFFDDSWRTMGEGGATLAWHTGSNLWAVWKPWADPVAHGLGKSLASGAWLLPLTLLGLSGLIASLFRGPGTSREVAALAFLEVLLLTASAAAFVGTFRYRFGHIDPVLCCFAGALLRRRAAPEAGARPSTPLNASGDA